ncbi:hypothetical protein [Haloferax sp. DFSO60]|uniref:hypothetical protein n=1 Tax=Haloferax sp. DFSO60 TaxID=3388652 RepID=UPI00397DDEBE
MTQSGDVRFHFRYSGGSPWHPTHKGDDFNPACDAALRIGGTWIPGENSHGIVYFEASEVSFLNEILRVLKRLYSGQAEVTMHAGNQGFLHSERVEHDHVRVTNHYSEEGITDESERLGIENTGVCPLHSLAEATLKRVRTIISYGRDASLPGTTANLFHVLEENAQYVEWEADQLQ